MTIRRQQYKQLTLNTCEMPDCREHTTAEGVMCRQHWNLADGELKANYQIARDLLFKDVWAKSGLEHLER